MGVSLGGLTSFPKPDRASGIELITVHTGEHWPIDLNIGRFDCVLQVTLLLAHSRLLRATIQQSWSRALAPA